MVERSFFIERSDPYEQAYSSLEALCIDSNKKKRIKDILFYSEMGNNSPPNVDELAKSSDKELDRLYRKYMSSATSKMRMPKF